MPMCDRRGVWLAQVPTYNSRIGHLSWCWSGDILAGVLPASSMMALVCIVMEHPASFKCGSYNWLKHGPFSPLNNSSPQILTLCRIRHMVRWPNSLLPFLAINPTMAREMKKVLETSLCLMMLPRPLMLLVTP